MKKNNMLINGKYYSLCRVCEMLGVSNMRVYKLMRRRKVDALDAILLATSGSLKFPKKVHKEEVVEVYMGNIEENMINPPDEICSEFGCANKLTITEKLCGTKCLKCQ